MIYYNTRYGALKDCPNAIIRKVLTGNRKEAFVAFHDCTTYETWKASKLVK